MQKRIRKPQKSQAFIDTEVNCMSFTPVNRNGWWIKFSTNKNDAIKETSILLLFTSMFTGQTIVKFFQNEDEAVDFINYVIEKNPTVELTIE